MTALLADNPIYHQLIKLNYFLLAYLACAGFPIALREKIANTLLLSDFITAYQYCANSGSELPIMNIDIIQIQQMFQAVSQYIMEAKQISNDNKYFQDSLISQKIDASLLGLQWQFILECTFQQKLISNQMPIKINATPLLSYSALRQMYNSQFGRINASSEELDKDAENNTFYKLHIS